MQIPLLNNFQVTPKPSQTLLPCQLLAKRGYLARKKTLNPIKLSPKNQVKDTKI
jgi:hypothetical protein